jgi:hypothetical protein
MRGGAAAAPGKKRVVDVPHPLAIEASAFVALWMGVFVAVLAVDQDLRWSGRTLEVYIFPLAPGLAVGVGMVWCCWTVLDGNPWILRSRPTARAPRT